MQIGPRIIVILTLYHAVTLSQQERVALFTNTQSSAPTPKSTSLRRAGTPKRGVPPNGPFLSFGLLPCLPPIARLVAPPSLNPARSRLDASPVKNDIFIIHLPFFFLLVLCCARQSRVLALYKRISWRSFKSACMPSTALIEYHPRGSKFKICGGYIRHLRDLRDQAFFSLSHQVPLSISPVAISRTSTPSSISRGRAPTRARRSSCPALLRACDQRV